MKITNEIKEGTRHITVNIGDTGSKTVLALLMGMCVLPVL